MKNAGAMFATALLSATIFTSATAVGFAQSMDGRLMSVNVPFAFQAAGTKLPPGHYTVTQMGPENVLNIRDASGRHGLLFIANADYSRVPAEHSKLVFLRTGADYRLQQIVHDGDSRSYRVWQRKSARDKEIAASGQIETLLAEGQ